MAKPYAYSHYSQNPHSSAHWTVFAHRGMGEFSISARHKIYASQHGAPPVSLHEFHSSGKKSLYELPFLLPPACNPLTSFSPFSLGESARRKKKKRSLLWTANRILFSRGARVFAYRVQILDGCSDRFSQRRKYTRASLLPERGNVSGIRRTLVGTARLSQDRHYFVWRTQLSREYSRGWGGGKKRGKLEERFLGTKCDERIRVMWLWRGYGEILN